MNICRAALAFAMAASSSVAVAADAECEAKFRQMLSGQGGDYPNTSRSVTETGGVKMTSTFVAQDDKTFLTIDDTSKSWVVLRDNTGWVSTDKGKSWKKAYTLDPAQTEKQKADLRQRAEEATNIVCSDGVAFEGSIYRRLSGDWKSTDGSDLAGHTDYYVKADGTWHAQVIDMTMGGQRTKITQVRVPEGDELTVPEVK